MSLLSDPRWSEALSHLPDYLGNHVRVSVAGKQQSPPEISATLPLSLSAPLYSGALNCGRGWTSASIPG